ncbi:nitrilase-related carbon-nitrogen hydrolase [Arthrobacter crystallopoietes]|uniref:nitrilase-related carbon-nitrogen hydrolase n=1 Tax=Crystallibacter crystallopoietes TaxID=37928 RepID=UPI001111609E|nr:nitrilase-related carbon-nitrogen hydrolase [Arthrobacter crystallopoietes]
MRFAVMQAAGEVLDVAGNLALVARAAAEAKAAGADILVTPELFACGYAPLAIQSFLDPKLSRAIDEGAARVAREHRIGLVYSAPAAADGGGWHITAALLDRAGNELLRYAKVHLFDREEQQVFVPGKAAPSAVDFEGIRVGLLICYDVEFPEPVRALADAGADIALVPTALGSGFQDVPGILLRARALESQLAIAYANHTGALPADAGQELLLGGLSVIVGPDGALLAQAGTDTEFEVLWADVTADDVAAARRHVPYLRDRRPALYRAWQQPRHDH